VKTVISKSKHLKIKDESYLPENFTGSVKYSFGTKCWYQNGKLHGTEGLLAVEYVNGSKFWFKNDKLHRTNGLPAVEWADGLKEWY